MASDRKFRRRGRPANQTHFPGYRPMSDEQLRAYREAQPKDTRDFTARFAGDPLPHRSALSIRNAAGGEW